MNNQTPWSKLREFVDAVEASDLKPEQRHTLLCIAMKVNWAKDEPTYFESNANLGKRLGVNRERANKRMAAIPEAWLRRVSDTKGKVVHYVPVSYTTQVAEPEGVSSTTQVADNGLQTCVLDDTGTCVLHDTGGVSYTTQGCVLHDTLVVKVLEEGSSKGLVDQRPRPKKPEETHTENGGRGMESRTTTNPSGESEQSDDSNTQQSSLPDSLRSSGTGSSAVREVQDNDHGSLAEVEDRPVSEATGATDMERLKALWKERAPEIPVWRVPSSGPDRTEQYQEWQRAFKRVYEERGIDELEKAARLLPATAQEWLDRNLGLQPVDTW